MKWMPSAKDVGIVDIDTKRPVRWETIKRDAMVTAVVRIKAIFVNTSLTSIQVEPVGLLVNAEKEVATDELFADEIEAHAAKRRRVAGPSEADESEEADDQS